jgi:hypothetical protein
MRYNGFACGCLDREAFGDRETRLGQDLVWAMCLHH